jgi:parvulin-like peptidyl-prolyl isomerase
MARRSLLTLLALVVLLALVGAGCGGGDDEVPENAVAVVDGQEITKTQFDALISQARKTFKDQKRPFPKAGTAERKQINDQAIQFLVQRAEFDKEAAAENIEISDADVEKRLDQIKKQYFAGNQKRYEKQLKDQGLTDEQVRADVRAQIVQEKLFAAVTKDVKVTDPQVAANYQKNKAQYGTPEQREVRHILVKTRTRANQIYDQLKDGASFAALAKQYSQDPGSKNNGGKLTITKGQTVAPFDQTAFLLEKNAISRPVKTQYGYHIIQPISAVTPAKTQPLDKNLKQQIRQQLLTTKRNQAMTNWVKGLDKQYKDKVAYGTGFAPAGGGDTGTTTSG